MKFELNTHNYKEFNRLCGKILFNPIIRSALFNDDYRVTIKLEKYRLADFADLIRNLDVEVSEPPY
jgi:hypothetical protein